MGSDRWFREFERNLANGQGYHQAAETARTTAGESLLDKADIARKRMREEPEPTDEELGWNDDIPVNIYGEETE